MGLKKNYLKSKNTCKVTFSLSKSDLPGVKSVVVVGDFNGWDRRNAITLKKDKKQYSATIELKADRDYEFRYILNDQHWYNDPNPDAYTPSAYMGSLNCVIKLDRIDSKAKSKKGGKKAPSDKKKSSSKKTPTKKVSAKKGVSKKATAKKRKTTSSALPRRTKTPRTAVKKATIARASTTKAKATTKRSIPPKSPTKSTAKDNLKRIGGIGPKMESLLNEKEIRTFEQLARLGTKKLQAIIDSAGSRFKKYSPTVWINQAKSEVAKKK